MRNCDPDADNRLPHDRASRCGNGDDSLDDRRQVSCVIGHHGASPCSAREQSACLHPSGWPQAISHDFVRELSSLNGVEPPECLQNALAFFVDSSGPGGSAVLRFADRSHSCSCANGGTIVPRETVHPFGSIRASRRLVSSFIGFNSSSWNNSFPDPRSLDAGARHHRESIRIAPDTTCSKAELRTHFLKKVSDEKRNADERPPSRGKSDRHR